MTTPLVISPDLVLSAESQNCLIQGLWSIATFKISSYSFLKLSSSLNESSMRLDGSVPLPSSQRPMPSSSECGRPCTLPLYSSFQSVPNETSSGLIVVRSLRQGLPPCPRHGECGTARRPRS